MEQLQQQVMEQPKKRKRTEAQRKKRNLRRWHLRKVSDAATQSEGSSSDPKPNTPPFEDAIVAEHSSPKPALEVQPEVEPEVKPKAKPKALISRAKLRALEKIMRGDVSFRMRADSTTRRPNLVVLPDFVLSDFSPPLIEIEPAKEVLSRPKVAEESNLFPLPLEKKRNFKDSEQDRPAEASLIRRPTRPALFVPPARPPLAEVPAKVVPGPANVSRPALDQVKQRVAGVKRPLLPRAKVLDDENLPANYHRSRSQSRSRSMRQLQQRKKR